MLLVLSYSLLQIVLLCHGNVVVQYVTSKKLGWKGILTNLWGTVCDRKLTNIV